MKISGFTMVRNAEKLYFPIKESIMSILPIVDEFVVAVGKGDDKTREIIENINSEKIKIYDRVWDEKLFVDGAIFREETNFALSKCSGDWCIYLQADEVIHEKYLDVIKEMCTKYLGDDNVEGLLLKYKHFWGDYNHYIHTHGWYQKEIRIVKNNINVKSYCDAQSFRIENRKLSVVEIPAYVYHYGWVRPPKVMKAKKKEQDSMHWGIKKADEMYKEKTTIPFKYGPLGRLPIFKETHPAVMSEWIKDFFWEKELDYGIKINLDRELMRHERLKYTIITLIEKIINNGEQIGGFKNYKRIKIEKEKRR